MTHLFIADDEPEIRRLVRVVAMQMGWSVTECSNGRELMRSVDHIGPGADRLIILDMMMPELDGFEVLGLLAEKAPEMPVCILTGGPDPMSAAGHMLGTARGCKIVDTLTKPFPMEAIVRLLGRFCPNGQE